MITNYLNTLSLIAGLKLTLVFAQSMSASFSNIGSFISDPL